MAMSPLYLAKHTGAEIDAAVDLANSALQQDDLDSAVASLESKINAVKDTTYTFAEGTTNGTISVTEDGKEAQEVAVHGLGSAAYTDTSAYDEAGAADAVKTELQGTLTTLQADVTANTTAIGKVTPVVPTEATAENQLVDNATMKAFVNSSIAAQAANFVTPTADGGQYASFAALQAGPWYIGGTEVDGEDLKLTKNDYAMYKKTTADGEAQWRALYNGTSWEEQYQVGSAFTAAEQAAIDSGITAAKVAAIAQNTQDITDLETKVNGMYTNGQIDEKVTDAIDGIPTASESVAGLVTLGAEGGAATYAALEAALARITALENLLSKDGFDIMLVKTGTSES